MTNVQQNPKISNPNNQLSIANLQSIFNYQLSIIDN